MSPNDVNRLFINDQSRLASKAVQHLVQGWAVRDIADFTHQIIRQRHPARRSTRFERLMKLIGNIADLDHGGHVHNMCACVPHVNLQVVDQLEIQPVDGRWFTRLTNAFSKKVENHVYAVAVHMLYYNFVRIHKTLRMSPAMAAGVSDRLWEIGDIVALVETADAPAKKRMLYRKQQRLQIGDCEMRLVISVASLLLTSMQAFAGHYAICMHETGCPFTVHADRSVYMACVDSGHRDAAVLAMAEKMCTFIKDGKPTIGTLQEPIQTQSQAGGSCGAGLWEFDCDKP